jgi:hemerythrin-like domain-containing protein
MLQRIRVPVAPGDAVDLLVECHGRIRGFLALARRLGAPHAAEPVEIRDAARQVHRYFTLALPLHAKDEEESILPRLRGRDPAVDAELTTMVREHQDHEQPMGTLVAACEELANDPGRRRELGPVAARAAEELERHFTDHLAREETVIFPAMRRLLDRATDSAIVAEIRRRRQATAGPSSKDS